MYIERDCPGGLVSDFEFLITKNDESLVTILKIKIQSRVKKFQGCIIFILKMNFLTRNFVRIYVRAIPLETNMQKRAKIRKNKFKYSALVAEYLPNE